ncbi:hypothetical protein NRIC_35680 [Enterococcus florum]|uniref:Uncharacterized protein n=1 Tax=Enterococcus florum TaxID=2480627 RepID=A0A4P5PBV9_9ENTE|nr:hypothetical protein [Enterococcus florum]GCF95677.1 hypothetical protein NRIC_35680 [Enterococcus florum]
MKQQDVQLTIYPTPAKSSAQVLQEGSLFDEIEKACVYLSVISGESLTDERKTDIRQYFDQYFTLTDATYHIELQAKADFPWKSYWQALHTSFPQFAWTRCQKEEMSNDTAVYSLDFVPIALQEEGFSFSVNLDESLKRHYGLPAKEAKERLEEVLLLLAVDVPTAAPVEETPTVMQEPERSTVHTIEETREEAPNDQRLETAQEGPQEVAKEARQEAPDKKAPFTEAEILPAQPDTNRVEEYQQLRMRSANKRLEMMVEKLEVSMIQNGIKFFTHQVKNEDDWHKRLTISLREYTYLMQKAKFLEQMWSLNGSLVSKTEKMTISGNTLVYERDQVKDVKAKLSTQDIQFVLYECQMIESRAKVRARPWFRKPYVKMMKMDYDNLVSKATYFDLLQGENYLLEQMIQEDEGSVVSEEVG